MSGSTPHVIYNSQPVKNVVVRHLTTGFTINAAELGSKHGATEVVVTEETKCRGCVRIRFSFPNGKTRIFVLPAPYEIEVVER